MTAPLSPLDLREDAVGIVGVGLIGGSIAAALKARGFTGPIIGSGRDPARLEAARRAGLLDKVTTGPPRASLIVVCTPVDRIAADVRAAAELAAPGTLITDAGSVKGPLCRELAGALPEGVAFIGAHPLAGSEKQGFEHAAADLFVDALCVIVGVQPSGCDAGVQASACDVGVQASACPDSLKAVLQRELQRTERFWQSLGARTVRMTAEDHDRAVARTSHLPHVVAAALVASLTPSDAPLAATGFRDTTRIAAGALDLWTAILLANAPATLAALDTFRDRLDEYRTAIAERDAAKLKRLLAQSKTTRDALRKNQA
ncbi:MAG: prephenate dehydrogenase/arogenate dehydrogenase family protein [Planctomycetales bacterium]